MNGPFNMNDDRTLREAQEAVYAAWEKGVDCPCCTQRVQLYRHKINSQIARCLVQVFQSDHEWVHILRELKPSNRMYSLARFWGLLESRGDRPDADKKSSGYWRLTENGKQFVRGQLTVPKYAFIFNDNVYRFSTEHVDIHGALGSKFSLSELMS